MQGRLACAGHNLFESSVWAGGEAYCNTHPSETGAVNWETAACRLHDRCGGGYT